MTDEDFVLGTLPLLDHLVSEANPEPWRTWLTKQDGPKIAGEVAWYNHVNCHYLVYKGRVIEATGYVGQVLFEELTTSQETKDQFFRERARYLRAVHNAAEAVDSLANSLHVAMDRRSGDPWSSDCPEEPGNYWIWGKRYNPPQWFQVRRVLGPDGSQRLRVSVDGSESVPRAWFTIPGYWFQPVRVPEPPQVPAETEPPKETDS
jgi:hypothetical protein